MLARHNQNLVLLSTSVIPHHVIRMSERVTKLLRTVPDLSQNVTTTFVMSTPDCVQVHFWDTHKILATPLTAPTMELWSITLQLLAQVQKFLYFLEFILFLGTDKCKSYFCSVALGGVCTSDVAVTCNPPNNCYTSTCNSSTGTCDIKAKTCPDSTACYNYVCQNSTGQCLQVLRANPASDACHISDCVNGTLIDNQPVNCNGTHFHQIFLRKFTFFFFRNQSLLELFL